MGLRRICFLPLFHLPSLSGPGFVCTVLEEDVFTAYLTWGFYSKTAASNNCSSVLVLFAKRRQYLTFFILPYKQQLWFFTFWCVEDVLIHSFLQPFCSTPTEMQKHAKCAKTSSVFHSIVRFDAPQPDFPATPQQCYKIFISILIVLFHALSFEVNAVMSDCSESRANPLLLLSEVTSMLVCLCLEAQRAHSELFILFMSLSTLPNLPVTSL